MNDLPARKQNRIEHYAYSSPGAYFVTICTAKREKVFWESFPQNAVGAAISRPQAIPLSPAGRIVEKVRFNGGENGRMISAPTLSTVIGQMKRWVSKRLGRSVWQKSFYDHAVRNRQDYAEIWQYIENNPLKYLQK